MRREVITGDCIEVMRGIAECSVDAIVTDPPYGLEFMGAEWDGPKGFRRADNPADVGRGNVFGRLSSKAPESTANWEHGAGFSKPGIGDRRTEWPSFGGSGANPTCAACGGRMRGAKMCACETPDWRVKGKPFDPAVKQRSVMKEYQEWCEAWAAEAYRVLKPGGRMLASGGPRTCHRLTCGIEEAGFLIEDSVRFFFEAGSVARELWETLNDGQRKALAAVMSALAPDSNLFWLYGQGFPKHRSKLKPAYEPIVVARKGGASHLNIDACRIEGAAGDGVWGTSNATCAPTFNGSPGKHEYRSERHPAGRWPANVVLDEEAAAALDSQTGVLRSGTGAVKRQSSQGYQGNAFGKESRPAGTPNVEYGDEGGASRFFYCPKASRAERGEGNRHPTVKPVSLVSWLVRLVTPPGGLVLDPFAGSGTTGVACVREGFGFVLIDREEEHAEVARRRVAAAEEEERQAAPLLVLAEANV